MLKKTINEFNLTLALQTKSPLLIRDGRFKQPKSENESEEKTDSSKMRLPDSFFVCRNTLEEMNTAIHSKNYSDIRFYIPGSSLRGVMRSHAEKIVRTLTPTDNICCIPHNNSACESKYIDSCVVCKLFGSMKSASRIYIHDSTVGKTGNIIERYGIGIDRFTGGVSEKEGKGMLFKNTLLDNYTFRSQITIRNFEIWQLGLLAYVLRDFGVFSDMDETGLLTIGYGKNRGFGRVKGSIKDVCVTYYDKDIKRKAYELMGVNNLSTMPADTYGFIENDDLPKGLLEEAEIDDSLYKKKCKIKSPKEFFKECAAVWNKLVKANKFESISELKIEGGQKL